MGTPPESYPRIPPGIAKGISQKNLLEILPGINPKILPGICPEILQGNNPDSPAVVL